MWLSGHSYRRQSHQQSETNRDVGVKGQDEGGEGWGGCHDESDEDDHPLGAEFPGQVPTNQRCQRESVKLRRQKLTSDVTNQTDVPHLQ